jgi:hypothetical protein
MLERIGLIGEPETGATTLSGDRNRVRSVFHQSPGFAHPPPSKRETTHKTPERVVLSNLVVTADLSWHRPEG